MRPMLSWHAASAYHGGRRRNARPTLPSVLAQYMHRSLQPERTCSYNKYECSRGVLRDLAGTAFAVMRRKGESADLQARCRLAAEHATAPNFDESPWCALPGQVTRRRRLGSHALLARAAGCGARPDLHVLTFHPAQGTPRYQGTLPPRVESYSLTLLSETLPRGQDGDLWRLSFRGNRLDSTPVDISRLLAAVSHLVHTRGCGRCVCIGLT